MKWRRAALPISRNGRPVSSPAPGGTSDHETGGSSQRWLQSTRSKAEDVAEAPVRRMGPGFLSSHAGSSFRGAGERNSTLWTSRSALMEAPGRSWYFPACRRYSKDDEGETSRSPESRARFSSLGCPG